MSDQFDDDFLRAKCQQLRAEPIAALEDCRDVYAMVDEVHAVVTYRLIVFLCDFVDCVRGSSRERKALLDHKFWDGPGHKPKQDRLTLVATRFALRARQTRSRHYERARTYAIVVDYYLDLEYTAEEVFKDLRKVTIQGVLNLHPKDDENNAPQGGDALDSSERTAMPKTSNMPDLGSTRRSDDSNQNSDEQQEESANDSGNQRPTDPLGQVKGRQTDDKRLDRGRADERKKGKRDKVSDSSSASTDGDTPQWKKVNLNESLPIDPGEYWDLFLGMRTGEYVDIRLHCVRDIGFKQYRVGSIDPERGRQRDGG